MDTPTAPMAPTDDPELVAAVVRGSQDAFAALYDRHARALYALALGLGRDRTLAEDVVQEAFLALWNHAERFDPALGSLRTWLSTIARNRTLDRLRSASRRASTSTFSALVGDRADPAKATEWLAAAGVPVAGSVPAPEPHEWAAAGEDRDEVRAALALLTDVERETIVLAFRDGLSHSEIASRLGWPLGTVKTRSRRALRRLREGLETTRADRDAPTAAVGSCCPA